MHPFGPYFHAWFQSYLKSNPRGVAETIVIVLVLFLLWVLVAGRRLVVQ